MSTASHCVEPGAWASVMEELRADYLSEARAKMTAIEGWIVRLDGSVQSEARSNTRQLDFDEELANLRRCFHALNGSGLTYGFPVVSALGSRGEDICRSVAASGGPPSAEHVATWRELLQELWQELSYTRQAA